MIHKITTKLLTKALGVNDVILLHSSTEQSSSVDTITKGHHTIQHHESTNINHHDPHCYHDVQWDASMRKVKHPSLVDMFPREVKSNIDE